MAFGSVPARNASGTIAAREASAGNMDWTECTFAAERRIAAEKRGSHGLVSAIAFAGTFHLDRAAAAAHRRIAAGKRGLHGLGSATGYRASVRKFHHDCVAHGYCRVRAHGLELGSARWLLRGCGCEW